MNKSGSLLAALGLLAGSAALALGGDTAPAAAHGIPHFAQVEPGVWRGGQPNAAGWEYLKSLGVKREMKLNARKEAADELAATNGIQIIYLPITLKQQTIGKPKAADLNAAVAAIKPDGTFVHCQHGQDRTGLVIGAYRVKVRHWTKTAAYKEMQAHGFHPLLRGLYWSWQEDVP